MPSFIADGYEFGSGFFPIEMVHDGLEVFHRPMTPADVAEYQAEAVGLTGIKLRHVQAKWLKKKITRWQMRADSNGTRGQIPKLTIGLLAEGESGTFIHPTLLTQLLEAVIWGDKPDYRLGPEGEQTDEEAVGN